MRRFSATRTVGDFQSGESFEFRWAAHEAKCHHLETGHIVVAAPIDGGTPTATYGYGRVKC